MKRWKYTFSMQNGVRKTLLTFIGKRGEPVKNAQKEVEEDITKDPIVIMVFILGEKASAKDIQTAEAAWKFIHKPDYKWKDLIPVIEDKVKHAFEKVDINYDEFVKYVK